MKKIIFTAALLISCISARFAKAQIGLHLSLNIGSQPDWGPVGYEHVSYYYIPDIDAYYDVETHEYIYLDGGLWVHRAYLPVRYRNYDLYGGYKVVINQPNPWLRATYYRTHYAAYRGRRGQAIIRNSHDVRYRNYWHGPARGPVRHQPVRPVRPAPGHGPVGRPGGNPWHGAPGHGGPGHGNPGHGPAGPAHGGFGHPGGGQHGGPGHGGPGHGGPDHGGGNPGHGGGHGGGHKA